MDAPPHPAPARGVPPRRLHGVGEDRGRARDRPGDPARSSSPPIRCSSTAAWTSAPPSRPPPSARASSCAASTSRTPTSPSAPAAGSNRRAKPRARPRRPAATWSSPAAPGSTSPPSCAASTRGRPIPAAARSSRRSSRAKARGRSSRARSPFPPDPPRPSTRRTRGGSSGSSRSSNRTRSPGVFSHAETRKPPFRGPPGAPPRRRVGHAESFSRRERREPLPGSRLPAGGAAERSEAEGVVHAPLVGLDFPPDVLNARIERRARAMFEGGLLDEVRALCERFPGFERSTAGAGIGYAEALAALRGEISVDGAVAHRAANAPPREEAAHLVAPPGARRMGPRPRGRSGRRPLMTTGMCRSIL